MGKMMTTKGGEKEGRQKAKGRKSMDHNPRALHLLQVAGQATQTDSRLSPMKPRSPRTLSPCLEMTQPGSPRQRLGRLRSPCKGGGLSSSSPSSPSRRQFASCSPGRPSHSHGRRSPLLETNPDLKSSSDSTLNGVAATGQNKNKTADPSSAKNTL